MRDTPFVKLIIYKMKNKNIDYEKDGCKSVGRLLYDINPTYRQRVFANALTSKVDMDKFSMLRAFTSAREYAGITNNSKLFKQLVALLTDGVATCHKRQQLTFILDLLDIDFQIVKNENAKQIEITDDEYLAFARDFWEECREIEEEEQKEGD